MGWDAFSDAYNYDNPPEAFVKAAERVRREAGSVDGLLSKGGLDISTCGEMLEQATNASVYDEDGWSAEKVQRLAKDADWTFPVDTKDKSYYLAALEFLNTCSREGVGVRFSW